MRCIKSCISLMQLTNPSIQTRFMKARIPVLLIVFRLMLAPIILFIAWQNKHDAKPVIVVLMYLALSSDLTGFNYAGIPFRAAIVLGLISHIDRILITLILPSCTHDTPSAHHAYLIRKGIAFRKNKLFN